MFTETISNTFSTDSTTSSFTCTKQVMVAPICMLSQVWELPVLQGEEKAKGWRLPLRKERRPGNQES